MGCFHDSPWRPVNKACLSMIFIYFALQSKLNDGGIKWSDLVITTVKSELLPQNEHLSRKILMTNYKVDD